MENNHQYLLIHSRTLERGAMNPEPTSNIFTVGEVAAYLKLPISTVYRLAERREIPGHKVGRQWRFQREVIDEWLRKRSEMRTTSILVADDDDDVRELLAEALEGPGRRVLQARNGVEAVQW